MKAHTAFDVFKHLALVLLTAVVLLLIFFFGYLPWTTNHGETIAVPKVMGMRLAQVEDFLDDHSLRYYVQDSTYEPDVPPHTVLAQDPAPGARVKENRKIYLTVSMQTAPMVAMPKLLDLSLKTATITLQNLGMKPGKVTTVPDLQQNAVLKQQIDGRDVKPGQQIPKNSVIDLVVGDGQGNNEFTLDNVVGQPYDEVRIMLQGQGLQVGSVIYQPNGSGEAGTVQRQRPTAGTQVRTGQLVDLWVSGSDPNGEAASQDASDETPPADE
jgi:eukaryotic-like serine/threonine-protein kinase